MAEGKKTFIFYSDWINMVREMPNEDAGELLKHILSYVNDENPETKNLLVKMAFGHMKPMIKADLIKWDSIREKRKSYGKKGGQAKAKQKLANAKQVEAVNDNVNDNVNVNVNKNVINKEADFKKSLHPFVGDYDLEMVEEFFLYWSEKNEGGKKMRFEYAKNQPFNISRRLATWKKNARYFKGKSQNKPTKPDFQQANREIMEDLNK